MEAHFKFVQWSKAFDYEFPGVARREHWLNIYLDHREQGKTHAEAAERIRFEMQHEPKPVGEREIEAWRELEAVARNAAMSGPLNNGMRDENSMAALKLALSRLDSIRNPAPQGRWAAKTK